MQKRSPAGVCYGMYTYLAVLLGSAAGSAGLGLLTGELGVGGMVGTWWGGRPPGGAAARLCYSR
jgi:predicted MFS family arabinose efflux permease